MEDTSVKPFDVGRALTQTFSVWLKNLPAFTLLSAICYSPLLLYTGVTFSGDGPTMQDVSTYFGITSVLTMVLAWVVAGAIVYGTVQQLRGLHAPTAKSVSVGLSRLIPVILVAIVAMLCVFGGSLLLVVPGLIVACMLYVAVPVAVIERQGVMGALKRSKALTDGSKLQIFALFLIVGVLNWLLTMVFSAILLGAGDSLGGRAWLTVGLSVVTSSFGAVMQAVVYYQLRQEKDGVSIDELAQVFE